MENFDFMEQQLQFVEILLSDNIALMDDIKKSQLDSKADKGHTSVLF